MGENKDIIKPATQPMSDEEIEKLQKGEETNKKEGPNSGLILGIVFGILIVCSCLFGVVYIIYKINNFGDQVSTYTENNDDWWEPNDTYPYDDDEEGDSSAYGFIGDDVYGYVIATTVWEKSLDADSRGELFYKDGLYTLKLMFAPSDVISTSDYAESLYEEANERGVESLNKIKVYIGEYFAYRVYYYLPEENIWESYWIFKTEDGEIREIKMTGPDIRDARFYTPISFTLSIDNYR